MSATERPEPSLPVDCLSVAQIIQALGYRAKVEKSETVEYILSNASGLVFSIWPYASGSLQFRLIFSDGGLSEKDCNEHNSRYRFGKVYIGPDGEVVLELDVLLDPPCLKRIVEGSYATWEGALHNLRTFIGEIERSKDAPGDHPNT